MNKDEHDLCGATWGFGVTVFMVSASTVARSVPTLTAGAMIGRGVGIKRQGLARWDCAAVSRGVARDQRERQRAGCTKEVSNARGAHSCSPRRWRSEDYQSLACRQAVLSGSRRQR